MKLKLLILILFVMLTSCARPICDTYKPVKNYKGYKVIRKQPESARKAMKNMKLVHFGYYPWESK